MTELALMHDTAIRVLDRLSGNYLNWALWSRKIFAETTDEPPGTPAAGKRSDAWKDEHTRSSSRTEFSPGDREDERDVRPNLSRPALDAKEGSGRRPYGILPAESHARRKA